MAFFDASNVEPIEDFDALPAGEYTVIIESSQNKPTKSGSGSFLELTLQVIDGKYKGRKLWDRLNLVNHNEKAVEIARRTLSAICHAVGVIKPERPEDLHDKPMLAKVSRTLSDYSGEWTNEVKNYKPLGGKQQATKPEAAKPEPAKPQDTEYSEAEKPPAWEKDAAKEVEGQDDIPF